MHTHIIFMLWLPLALAAGKRGLGWPWDNNNNPAIFGSGAGEVSWIYNWELWKPDRVPKNMKFISTARTADAGPNIASYMKGTGSKVLHCLNEPDMPSQANLNVRDAVSFYKKYCQPMRAKGVKVIAPSVTNGGGQMGLNYLAQFIKQCKDCKIDGISKQFPHKARPPLVRSLPGRAGLRLRKDWYGSDIGQFKAHIQSAMKRFPNRPIWVTEFALNGPNGTTKLTTSFIKQAIKFLDGTKQVVFYAPFGAFKGTGGMIASDGKLNTIGKAYKQYIP